jgi:hypothetical protein
MISWESVFERGLSVLCVFDTLVPILLLQTKWEKLLIEAWRSYGRAIAATELQLCLEVGSQVGSSELGTMLAFFPLRWGYTLLGPSNSNSTSSLCIAAPIFNRRYDDNAHMFLFTALSDNIQQK